MPIIITGSAGSSYMTATGSVAVHGPSGLLPVVITGSLTVSGSNTIVNYGSFVSNESGYDHDFRVESVDETHMIFVEGSSSRVGIGTATPERRLHVSGNVSSASILVASDSKAIELLPANGPTLRFGTPDDTDYFMNVGAFGGYNQIGLVHSGTDFQISGSAGGIGYYFDQSESLIGIGTQSPQTSLHVSSSGDEGLLCVSGKTNGPILFVTGSDRVGIGTTAPSASLHISSSSDETLFRIDGGTGHAAGTPILFVASESGSTGVGSVGINTATPNAAKYVLDTPVSGVIKAGNIEVGSWPQSVGYGFLGHSNQDHHGTGRHTKYNLLIGNNGSLDLNAAAGNLGFRSGATLRAAIDATTGYFGIGEGAATTWTPASLLHVSGTVQVGVDGTGHDVKFFGATSGQYMLWDQSADELVLAGDTKLSFHDASESGGGENIIATSNGHLEVNAGTTLDMTAPTIDLNASTAVTIDGPSVLIANNATNTPVVEIRNAHNGGTAGILKFNNTEGGNPGTNGDTLGTIEFWGTNNNGDGETIQYAEVHSQIADTADGNEGGKLTFEVASHDGELVAGLILTDGSAEDEIDVTIASGASSVTAVSGLLTTVGSITPTTDNAVDLGAADKRWANIYTGDLHLANDRGDWTVIEEEDYLTIRSNKTGKRFKLLMEEIED